MNAAEMNTMGILHSHANLARTEELFVDRSQIQGPSIDITAGFGYSSLNMPSPPAAENVFKNGLV
jgi:hypothetical protein